MIKIGTKINIFIFFFFNISVATFIILFLLNNPLLKANEKKYFEKIDQPITLKSQCKCRKETIKILNYTTDFSRPLCDLYKVLRRGDRQKVVSYSLYGYDKSINQSIICEYECLKDDVTGKYTDIIDFCNINEIPFGNPIKTWDAQYMHSMKWRFLPIGDPFVDMFMSRDLDSWIIEREVAAVKEWFDSNTLFHVMRGLIL